MNRRMFGTLRNEKGITALETAIILIAFVVVASVFAFTILSAGTFSTERGKEAIYAGLSEVRGSMVIKGSVVASANVGLTAVECVTITLSNAAGGEPVDLRVGDAQAGLQKISVDYRSLSKVKSGMPLSITWLVGGSATGGDGDDLLEAGELAALMVPLANNSIDGMSGSAYDAELGIDEKFALEIKPPKGATLLIERTTPPSLTRIMDFK